MEFIADFHVHSKFSRATAKNLDLENLYIAAQIKGITVVGTGDFTYPGWFSEICEKLQPAEPGLFKLKDEYARICDKKVPLSCRAEVRFILSTEISNIYKKNAKTRKNHNLIMVPDLAVTEKFNAKLDKIGNIKSDGRPILGLDARDLFEILLETSDEAFLIPAHVWTPWFSVLGSKSGFDSLEECFEDLTPSIFAIETGLSSDPPMNRRVSGLDGLTLVSNSDAHSPLNLGREANLLSTDLSFKAIKAAIKSGDPDQFLGTVEFFPEEGKYHFDGHRTCNVRLHPRETMQNEGKCPVCGKDPTIGVLHRVEELADRGQDQIAPNRHPYYSMVQLVDILSQIFKVGAKSKKVLKNYQTAINKLGPEFNILHTLEPEVIDGAGIPLLGEAIRRTRNKEIEVLPGYDGEYGQVLIFRANERQRLTGQKALFSIPPPPIQPESVKKRVAACQNPLPLEPAKKIKAASGDSTHNPAAVTVIDKLNSEQRRAVNHPGGPLLIIAGPGTGKTRTLTHRIAHLIMEKGVSPQNILAVTFTNKAAAEMRARLKHLMGNPSSLPLLATFHSFCFSILKDQKVNPSGIVDEDHRRALISEAIKRYSSGENQVDLKPREILHRIIAAKQHVLSPDEFAELHSGDSENDFIAGVYRIYQQLLALQGFCDFEDLIFNIVRLLESKSNQSRCYQKKYQHIYIDEYQDLNQAQYRIIRALAPDKSSIKDLCVIGDPDQSIYGFRGSDTVYFKRFIADYPGARVLRLTRNYRSTQTILNASFQVIQNHRLDSDDGGRTYSQKIDGIKTISILELSTEKAEAETIGRIITQQIGGTGFHSVDTGMVTDANLVKACSYSDFAVLYRTHAQHQALADVFDKQGIPFQVVSRENALNLAGLPELISFFKVIEGDGGFFDIEKIVQLAIPGFGLSALGQFKDWCFQNRFGLREGLKKAVRFPVPGLKASRQQVLNDFSNQISQYKIDMSAMPVADRLRYLEKNTGLYRILNKDTAIQEAFAGLIEFAGQFESDRTEFLAAVALHTDTDVYTHRVEKVSLMTMHAAKGLEFPVIFIAGCERGFIPFKPHGRQLADMAEERRLFYVAMTRAMQRLYLTRAKKRRIYGQTEPRVLSPFVADIENQLKKDETPQKKKTGTDQKQLKLF